MEKDCRIAPKGMYRVVSVDKFHRAGEATEIIQDFKNKQKALKFARECTIENMKDILRQHRVEYSLINKRKNKKIVPKQAKDSYSMAMVFYIYDDKMKYLGGDVWVGE